MFLLYHSEGRNICKTVLLECYVNDLYTTTCSDVLGHCNLSGLGDYSHMREKRHKRIITKQIGFISILSYFSIIETKIEPNSNRSTNRCIKP
jgi:hypothetical protein